MAATADRFVERLPLMREETFVADFLGQDVCKTIAEPGRLRGLSGQAGCAEPPDRGSKIDVGPDHVREERVLELSPERRRHTSHLSRLGLEMVESSPNDSLNRVWQRQLAVHNGLVFVQRHRTLFDECPTDLFQEERIATGALEQPSNQSFGHASGAQSGPDDCGGRRVVERLERHADAAGRGALEDGWLWAARHDAYDPLRRNDAPHPAQHGA